MKIEIEEGRRETDIEIQNKVVVMKVEEALNRSLLESEATNSEKDKMQLTESEVANSYYYCDCGRGD